MNVYIIQSHVYLHIQVTEGIKQVCRMIDCFMVLKVSRATHVAPLILIYPVPSLSLPLGIGANQFSPRNYPYFVTVSFIKPPPPNITN